MAKGFGETNSLAILTKDASVIINPPANANNDVIDFIRQQNKEIILLEPHQGHNIGVPFWTKAFPSAKLYTSPKAIPRLEKLCKIKCHSIEELFDSFKDISFQLSKGCNETSMMIRISTGERSIVYLDETLIHLNKAPDMLIAKFFFWLNNVKPIFQVNWNYLKFFVKDPKELAQHCIDLIEDDPILVLAHGLVKNSEEELNTARKLLKSILSK